MRPVVSLLVLALAARGAAAAAAVPDAAAASPTADAGAPPAALPACVAVATESRYVPYGFNHIVTVRNGCSRAAACTVSTDVNPDKQAIDVAAGQSVEVTTFLGAAASAFTARVGCRLR
jgi:hypothetical protein